MRIVFKRNIVLIVALLMLSEFVNATYIDNAKIKQNTFDTLSIIQLIDSAGSLINTNPSSARILLKEAIIACNEVKYHAGKGKIFNTLGILVYQKGEIDSAGYYFEQSLKQWERLSNKKEISNLLGNLSVILAQQNQIAKAISYNKKSIKVKLELKDTITIANGYNNLGNLYQDIGNTEEALYFQHKSLKLRIAIMDSTRLPASYINLGDLHNFIGNLDSAKYYGEKALSIQFPKNDKWGMANSYGVLAEFHYLNNDLDSALMFVDESIALVEEIGAVSLLEEMTILKTSVLIEQQKTNRALQTIYGMPFFSDPLMKISTLKMKAQLHQQLRNNKKAASYYKKYHLLKDTISEGNKRNRIEEISANHFYELQELELKMEQEIEENFLKMEVAQKEAETTYLYLFVVLSAVLIILFIFLYLSLNKRTKRLKLQREEINQFVQVQKEVIEARKTAIISNENAISQYTFLNTHELKEPLTKILNIVNLSNQEDIGQKSSLISLRKNAEELEVSVRKISKALHKGL